MPHSFKGNAALRAATDPRREATLERLRAAVERVAQENRTLQAEVAEFQNALGDIRTGIALLGETTEEYRTQLSAVKIAPLRHAARRLGTIADGWLDRQRGELGRSAGQKGRKVA